MALDTLKVTLQVGACGCYVTEHIRTKENLKITGSQPCRPFLSPSHAEVWKMIHLTVPPEMFRNLEAWKLSKQWTNWNKFIFCYKASFVSLQSTVVETKPQSSTKTFGWNVQQCRVDATLSPYARFWNVMKREALGLQKSLLWMNLLEKPTVFLEYCQTHVRFLTDMSSAL